MDLGYSGLQSFQIAELPRRRPAANAAAQSELRFAVAARRDGGHCRRRRRHWTSADHGHGRDLHDAARHDGGHCRRWRRRRHWTSADHGHGRGLHDAAYRQDAPTEARQQGGGLRVRRPAVEGDPVAQPQQTGAQRVRLANADRHQADHRVRRTIYHQTRRTRTPPGAVQHQIADLLDIFK